LYKQINNNFLADSPTSGKKLLAQGTSVSQRLLIPGYFYSSQG